MSVSREQAKLYSLIANFTSQALLGLISNVYDLFGPKILSGDKFYPILLDVAEKYFNTCVMLIQDRSDDYINDHFDNMCKIKLAGPSHPIDMLNIAVLLALHCINGLNLTFSADRNGSLSAARTAIAELLAAESGRASGLIGCTADHDHKKITGKIYEFVVDEKQL
jgi:hypothetical protein